MTVDPDQSEEKEIELEQGMETHPDHTSPVLKEVAEQSTTSSIAFAGHPIHAMLVHFPIAFVIATLGVDVMFWWSADPFWVQVGTWSASAAFVLGILAGVVGTLELLAVPGIRVRVASWNHAIAAMVLIAIAGANAGLRLFYPTEILPNGLMLSLLASMATAFAGWHGGKLVFDHGIGLVISPRQ